MKIQSHTSSFKKSTFSRSTEQSVEEARPLSPRDAEDCEQSAVDHHTVASSEPGHYHLLSVAINTLNWWEDHQFDLVEAGDKLVFRYSQEPSFVTHARTLYLQLCPA